MKDDTTILFVVNDPRFFVTHRLGLAKGIRKAGYAVHVATPTAGYESDTQTILAAGFPLHEVAIERQGLNPFRDAKALLQLIRLYRRLRPQIVHHVTVKPVLYGTLAAQIARVPAVVNAISGLGRLFATDNIVSRARAVATRRTYKLIFKHTKMCAIFQNQEDRRTFIQAGIVSERSSTLIAGSGTELDRFDPSLEPETPPIVLLPARLLRQKGVREFVAAARTLRAEKIVARFAIVGDTAGNRDAMPARELEEIEKEGVVELWGWSDDIPRMMSRASIICLPSYHEGLPKALIDGCAAGRPIVATDIAGCRAVVTHGLNGMLVPARDSPALANAIRILLADPSLRAHMGQKSRGIAEKNFDIAMVTQATLSVYAMLLAIQEAVE
jgi:glycosyltransferase involved in cell wall biosynthesis